MNKRWVGFAAAVFCYVVGVAALFEFFDTSSIHVNSLDELMMIALGLLFLPSLMAGIGLLAARKWRAFQGWLMGLALTVIFSIGALTYLLSQMSFHNAYWMGLRNQTEPQRMLAQQL